ncbi:hypothetical protein LguiA_003055 [Lonicera macranthoides]
MKKAIGQTVRDLKREVNKKVLKVPSIEQKVLDATSNEPWGPHGSHLADIAQATRNYHEYQMIMSVLWKRINDTGKNWRHVYKALTVLEYLVANGSERVIEDIREHAYQISTLSEFQYIDSSGRDQGSNVRKKSQSLVVLVNDKERIQEVRQKAAANREKYRNTSAGGMYRPGSYSSTGGYGDRYDDDRYGSRDEDRNGYGRERDDDRYGRYGDSYGRDGDRYGRDYEDRSNRDGYRDDDYRGRSRSDDDYNYGSRSRSADRDRDRAYEDDGQYSSRGSNARGDDRSQDGSVTGKPIERKFSEQNLDAPPSYEEAVAEVRSPVHSERDGEIPVALAPPKSSSPVNPNNQATIAPTTPAAPSPAPAPAPANKESDGFDEFDPRGSFSAAPPTSNGAEMDLLGSLSDSFSSNSMAIVPATTTTDTTAETDAFANSGSGQTFLATSSASTVPNQAFDDPFGDGPFRAIPSTNGASAQPVNVDSSSSFQSSANQSSEQTQKMEMNNNFRFGDAFSSGPYNTSASTQLVPSQQYLHQEPSNTNQEIDILADILPPSGPSQTSFPSQSSQPASLTGFPAHQQGQPPALQSGGFLSQPTSQTSFPAQMGQTNFPPVQMGGQPPSMTGLPPQGGQPPASSLAGFPSQMTPSVSQAGFLPQPGGMPNPNFYGNIQGGSYGPPPTSQIRTTAGPAAAQYNNTSSNFLSQSGASMPSSQPAPSSTSLAIVPQPAAKDKFETKSSVWADTLNRGLVNLNISGPKTNPLADIGVDFDAINRREKRMEKPSAAPVVSNVTMGKAMGSGSGMGRAGAGALRAAPTNPMMGSSGMGMGISMGGPPPGGAGIGMGGYGGRVNHQQQPPMGGMGMGMNMGMGQGGFQMQQQQQPPAGFPPGTTNMPGGGYNPMSGVGGYGQPYGGYR